MSRKFYRTVYTITVLSDEPISPDMELEDVLYECEEGGWSQETEVSDSEELTGEQMAKALQDQNSDPEFFGLNEDGTEIKQ